MERRLLKTIVGDATSITGAPLVELLVRPDIVGADAADPPILVPGAVAGTALTHSDGARTWFEKAWGALAPQPPPEGRGPAAIAVPAAILALLAGLPRPPRDAKALAVRLHAGDELLGALRFTTDGRAAAETVRAARAFAHQASLHLENLVLRRQVAGRESHYRTLLEQAAEAIFLVEPATGRIVQANRRAGDLTGYRPKELIDQDLTRLVSHPRTPRSDLLMRLLGSSAGRDESYSLTTATGALLPVSIAAAAIGTGASRVLQLIAKDLSTDRRARDAVDRARETLAALAVAGTHLMVETDEAAIFRIIANELGKLGFQSAVLLGEEGIGEVRVAHLSYPPSLVAAGAAITGVPACERVMSLDRVPHLSRALHDGRTVSTDRVGELVRFVFPGIPDEKVEALKTNFGMHHMVFAPLRIGGQVAGVLAVLATSIRAGDVEAIDNFALHASTAIDRARLWQRLSDHSHKLEVEVERRTRELTLAVRALREVDRRKDNFLANISHELRTPLVTILGYTQLLASDKLGRLDPKQRDAVEVALGSGRRLKAFIDELLDFSRYELTRDALQATAFPIAAAIDQVAKSIAPRLAERGVRLLTRVHPKTPEIWGDRGRLVQVLDNLVVNAERHCPAGGRGWVRVAAARCSGGRVGVSVADNGVGIEPQHLGRIFDRLYQVGDARPAREGGGLGLGLNIAKSIVEAHGGTVRVWSRPGRGARFTFLVPSIEILRGGPTDPQTSPGEPERPF